VGKKKRKPLKSRNPIARAVTTLPPKVVESKKRYNRKSKPSEAE
jgi:hypothetical protein